MTLDDERDIEQQGEARDVYLALMPATMADLVRHARRDDELAQRLDDLDTATKQQWNTLDALLVVVERDTKAQQRHIEQLEQRVVELEQQLARSATPLQLRIAEHVEQYARSAGARGEISARRS